MSSQKLQHQQILKFVIGTSGIFLSYVVLAIFAEHLYSAKYPSTLKLKKDGSPAEHRFVHPNIVVLCSTLFCAIFGLTKSYVTN